METHSSILARRIPMDRGAWWAVIHRVAKSQTQLSNYAQHSTEGINCTVKSITLSSGIYPLILNLESFPRFQNCNKKSLPFHFNFFLIL